MIDKIFEESAALFFTRGLIKKYRRLEDDFEKVYSDSLAHSFIMKLSSSINNYFGSSLLNRVFQAKEEDIISAIEESAFIGQIARAMKTNEKSMFFSWMRQIKKTIGLHPLKTFGAVVLIVVLANMTVSVVLLCNISPAGWFIKCLFLFIGLAALSSDTGWDNIKRTSLFLRLLNRFHGSQDKR